MIKKLALLLATASVISVNAYTDPKTREKLKNAIMLTNIHVVKEILPQISFSKDEKEAFAVVAERRVVDLKASLDDITGSVVTYSNNGPHRSYGRRTDIGYQPHWTWRHVFLDTMVLALIGGATGKPEIAGLGAITGLVAGSITAIIMDILNSKNYEAVLRQAYENAVSIEFEIRGKEVTA